MAAILTRSLKRTPQAANRLIQSFWFVRASSRLWRSTRFHQLPAHLLAMPAPGPAPLALRALLRFVTGGAAVASFYRERSSAMLVRERGPLSR